MSENHRADKWLWAVRLFKTRSLAAEACRGGKIKLNGDSIKPARMLRPGDEISFRSGLLTRTVRVLGFPASRVGAKLTAQYLEDLTPPEDYARAKEAASFERPFIYTGKGRPTKKDRRKIDGLL